jgi:transposase
MKNHQIGIDISKEKVNICLRSGKKSVWEYETPNTVASIKKAVQKGMKERGVTLNDVIVCAEFTGRYIYPLVCACDELRLFLWMEDPTRIKNSFGIARGKDDKIDARRIAEYADRFSDKAVAYGMPDRTLASIKSKLADRDMLLEDRKRYETQLHDQKGFMDPKDYAQKSRLWNAVIKTLNKQLALLDEQLAGLVASDEKISHQMELLKSVDGIGDRIALYMVAVTMGFKRFENPRQFFCYAGLAPFKYTSGKSIHSKSKVSQRANKHIKALLHLAAVSAATHMKDSEYKRYYERKTDEGKHPMLVLNVVRAKLVSRMFAVIRRDSEYQRNYDFSINHEKLSA